MPIDDQRDAIRVLAKPFFDQGYETVHAAVCCGRAFVSKDPIEKCKTCGSRPEVRELDESFLIDNP